MPSAVLLSYLIYLIFLIFNNFFLFNIFNTTFQIPNDFGDSHK